MTGVPIRIMALWLREMRRLFPQRKARLTREEMNDVIEHLAAAISVYERAEEERRIRWTVK